MVEIEQLKPHEEVIESVAAKLADDIRQEGVVRDPLIVDQQDHIILDGMHRFESLRRLGCHYAPCCLLDYSSPHITVGCWFRVFNVEKSSSVAQEILSKNKVGYAFTKGSLKTLSPEPGTIILTEDGTRFSLTHPVDTFEHSRIAADIEKEMVTMGLNVEYLSESLAVQRLKSELVNYVIVLPAFTKDMIRKYGSQGLLLPHKVTRHVIPSRPMEICVPLSLLIDPHISLHEADEKLDELLTRRRIERKPPGSVIDGRRYDEEVIMFST